MGVVKVQSKRLKLLLGTVGAGALLGMGVLTVAIGDVNAAVPQPVPSSTGITTGETSTETTAPSEPETSIAVPPITTAPYTIPTGEPQ
jgi:hypothetical protein